MAWNDLSISQRSQLMNIFRRNGVTSLSDMRNMYDSSLSGFNSSLGETTDSFGRPRAYFGEGGAKKKQKFDKPVSWYVAQRPDLYPDIAKIRPEYLDKYFYIDDKGQLMSNLAYHKFYNKRKAIRSAIEKIDYNQDNEIVLTTDAANARYRTGKISTNVLDYIYDNAAKAGIPFKEAVGLAGKESTLGIGMGYKRGQGISPMELYSFWVGTGDAVRSNKQIQKLFQVYKDMYSGKQVDQKVLDANEEKFQKMHDKLHEFQGDNWVKAAYDYYKGGHYNPGEIGYDEDVLTQGDAILSDKAVQKWLKTKKPYKGRGFSNGGNLYYNGGEEEGGSRAYGDSLSTEEEQQFKKWYSRYASYHNLSQNPDDKEHYYDYRGYWKSRTKEQANDEWKLDSHLPDTYKLPGHPTFSNESIYASEKNPGGTWRQTGFGPIYNEEYVPFQKMKDGGSIHIDPSKKGTFTAAATKHDMGVQEFASYVSAHPDAFSSAMRKKAAFAKAAKKFKHSFGGIKF